MLEKVSLGQSRFMTPGVAPDPRGVVLGRYGLLQFSSIEGVVSWFRLYSADNSLDELLPGLQILRARTPLQSQELLLRIPAGSSYTMDAAARCAKLVGGATFTGTGKHFVQYRDEQSPYGYDAPEIRALPAGAHFMLHAREYDQSYSKEGELSFEKLLFRLSLKRVPPGFGSELDRSELLMVVERGLATGVIRYLWRNRVHAEVGLVRSQGQSSFDELGRSSEFMLLRTLDLPERIVELFRATPGIELFVPEGTNAAVQLGYRHVIELSSCASVFDESRFYLFWGHGRVDEVNGPLELSGIEHLTSIDVDIEAPEKRTSLDFGPAEGVSVTIQLAPTMKQPTRVAGTLIQPEQAGWIKRLVYLMPPSVLRGHRMAATDRGILLIADTEIDLIPLGMLLVEITRGLLIPAGTEVVPRVAPEVLAHSMGHQPGMHTIFPLNGAAFRVSDSDFVPLEREALAKMPIEEASVASFAVSPAEKPTVVNVDVGSFALWGFDAPDTK